MEISLHAWLRTIERGITSAIVECNPRGWNEDHISYSWLQRVTSMAHHVSVTNRQVRIGIAWDAFKADGELEEEHGDIAFLVRVTFPRRRTLLGVAFLEAKRSYTAAGDFQAINWDQLEHQTTRTSHHRLLLYTQSRAVKAGLNVLDLGFCRRCFPGLFRSVHATVLPSEHALALRTRGQELVSFGLPLSYQICCRYLRGFDLDFDTRLVRAVQRGVVGGVRYLLVAHVDVVLGADTPRRD